jgi:peptidoglycan/LPS O-acetylase OafA/YrhL
MPEGHAQRPTHYPALDGLRAIAVLLVLYNHAPQLLAGNDGSDGSLGPAWLGSRGAWLGVDLFFVLSGFLITSILLRSRGTVHAFRRFWVRRALRIFPLAWLYLGVAALCGALVQGLESLRPGVDYVWAATYLINFHIAAQGWTAAALGILWSLAVEEHFYLAWPLAALRARPRTLVACLAAVVLLTPLLRWWLLPGHGRVAVYVTTFCRWDTLACGALLAFAWASPRRERVAALARWLALPAVAFVALVVGGALSPVASDAPAWLGIAGYSGVAVAFTVWCALALEPPAWLARALGSAPLRWIGRVSYGVYVWHVLTAQLVALALARLQLGGPLVARVALWLAVLFVTAAASYRWFEAPFLRLKDRLAAA